MTSGISYTNATYTTVTTSSTPAPYYGTTGTATTMANANANASKNTVTIPAVTKTPALRLCERSGRCFSRREHVGGDCKWVKFNVPPRSTVNRIAKVETAGGGQEEEEGDVRVNEEEEVEELHEHDGGYEAESSPVQTYSTHYPSVPYQ